MIAQAAVLGQGHNVGGDDGNVVYFVGDVERAGPPARASETMSRMGWPFATALSCASPVMVRGVRGIVRGVSPVYSKSVLVYGMASGLGQAVWGGKAPYGTMAGSTLVSEQVHAHVVSHSYDVVVTQDL